MLVAPPATPERGRQSSGGFDVPRGAEGDDAAAQAGREGAARRGAMPDHLRGALEAAVASPRCVWHEEAAGHPGVRSDRAALGQAARARGGRARQRRDGAGGR